MNQHMINRLDRAWLTAGVLRLLVFALIWMALTQGQLIYWGFGLSVVIGCSIVSLMLIPPSSNPWRPRAIVRLAGFFLVASFLGGVDVSRRAIRPRLALEPVFVERSIRLRSGAGRVLFASLINLLPGTLCARLEADRLKIHVLDRAMPVEASLDRLEHHVAELFGERIGS